QVAAGNRGGHLGDVTDLVGEIRRHEVDVIGKVFPGSADSLHLRLAAELSFGTNFAGDAGYFRREGRQLVHHGVDGVLQFENFSFLVDGDLLRQVAIGHGGGDRGDVTDLAGEVRGHRIHVIGEVLPGTGHAAYNGLAAKLSFGT